jgi:heat shock protein HtpX
MRDGKVDISETTIRIATFILLFVPFLIKNTSLFGYYFPRMPDTIRWILSHPESYGDWIDSALLTAFSTSIMLFGVFAVAVFLAIPQIYTHRYHLKLGGKLPKKVEETVERISLEAGLKKPPRVYILDVESPESFVFGRWKADARLALSSSIIDSFDSTELEGVVAHEVGHIVNNDIWMVSWAQIIFDSLKYWFVLLSTIGFTIVYVRESRFMTSFFDVDLALFLQTVPLYFVFLVIFPWIVLSSTGRTRESLADARASILWNRESLIQALEKIHGEKGKASIKETLKSPRFLSIAPSRIAGPPRNFILRYLFDSHPSKRARIGDLCSDSYVTTSERSRMPGLATAAYIGIVSFYVGIILGNVYGALVGIEHISSVDSILTFGALQDIGFVTLISPIVAVLLNLWTWRHSVGPNLGFTSMLSRILLSMVVSDLLFNLIFVIPKTTLLVIYEQKEFFKIVVLTLAFITLSLYGDTWVKRVYCELRKSMNRIFRHSGPNA